MFTSKHDIMGMEKYQHVLFGVFYGGNVIWFES